MTPTSTLNSTANAVSTDTNDSRKADLVIANHILVNEGVLDGFGHISVRDAQDPTLFYIARSMAPGLVTSNDIVACNLDGEVIDKRNRRSYVERFIHSEIYRARPDVQSVVHSHSPGLIPFGVTGARLRPICHMSGFLGATTPVFEIRHSIGDASDLLITNQALGKALADVLGPRAVALMRGHGSVTVGVSIQQAVFRAINTEKNAQLQADAMRLARDFGGSGGDNGVMYLSDAEAQATSDMNDAHLDRPWQVWKREALARVV